jgi:DNA-binding response OmpR family regulator
MIKEFTDQPKKATPRTLEKRFTILIVDDDADTREILDLALRDDYGILLARDGEEAVALSLSDRPDLVILDVNMPGRDGLWACAQLRTDDRTKHIPVVILSSRRELGEKLEAYSVGADDYLEKPFTMPELKAKVTAKLRRLDELMPQEMRIGNLNLFVDRFEVDVAGRKTSLSALETRLLAYFIQNPDRVLPRDQILAHVWKDVNVSARTVDAHIVGLRRKIDGFDHEIATVYGAGYALRDRH